MSSPSRLPAPVVIPGGHGLVVPGELVAELAAALDGLVSLLSRPVPASVRQPRVTAAVLVLRDAARQAAADHEAARHRVAAACAVATAPVVVPAQARAASEATNDEITTSQAAVIGGRSRERWRQLAASGQVRARRTDRHVWLLNRGDVISYDGRHGGDDDGRGNGSGRAAV